MLVILFLLLILILFLRPRTIEDISKAIVRLVNEFKSESKDNIIEEIAKSLGIDVEGKSDEELRDMILKKLERSMQRKVNA